MLRAVGHAFLGTLEGLVEGVGVALGIALPVATTGALAGGGEATFLALLYKLEIYESQMVITRE